MRTAFAVCLVGVSLFVGWAKFPFLLAYSAAGMERLGLQGTAADTYHFSVTRYPTQAPEWAFSQLARLRFQPAMLIDIAELAIKGQHSLLAISLYEAAVTRSGKASPVQWIVRWAELVASSDPQKGAELYLIAAKLALDRDPNPSAHVLEYFGRSLALRDDADVRWTQAQLYWGKNIEIAESILRRMITGGQKEFMASHALGILLWDRGRINEAESFLKRAAEEDSFFRPTLDSLNSWRDASRQLNLLQSEDSRVLTELNREEANAVSQHALLSTRLSEFDCDVRQFANWESILTSELNKKCLEKRIDVIAGGLATIFLLLAPVGRLGLGRLGTAAEVGAAARAGRVAEASALTRSLPKGGPNAAKESIAARKNRPVEEHNNSFDASFKAALNAEHTAVVSEIRLAFSTQRQAVIQKSLPAREQVKRAIASQEEVRTLTIINIRKTTYSFGISLAIPGLM